MKPLTMKRALIVALGCWIGSVVQLANAGDVKLRSSTKTSTSAASNASLSSKDAAETSKPLANQTASSATKEKGSLSSSQESVPQTEEKSDPSSPKEEHERNSRDAKSDESTRKRASAIPSKPLEPLSDEELEKRYPRVQGATFMTLGYLVPTKNLHNVSVLRAFTRIPRVDFVSKKQRNNAYLNIETPLESTSWEPKPYDVAYALEALEPTKTDRVLVVETGSGYYSAVLSCLVAEVYAVGADRNDVKRAVDACKKHGYSNVFHLLGDPTKGWADVAPFDKIVITRAISEIPSELVEQLKDGGKIVAPVGDRFRQLVVLWEKIGDKLVEKTLEPTRVELLTKTSPERVLPPPALIGGDFEELDPEPAKTETESKKNASEYEAELERDGRRAYFLERGATPKGWYDAWNFEVAERDDAYSGARVCVFSNEAVLNDHEKRDRNEERIRAATLPEERRVKTETGEAVKKMQRDVELCCQMKQSFPLDGTTTKKLVVSGAYRVAALGSRYDRPTARLVSIEFFDKGRKSLGEETILEVSFLPSAWQEFSKEISAPSKTKEATITIGLVDGVGTIEMDALEIKDKFERPSRER